MGEKVDHLVVALAGSEHVSGYTRVSSTGRTVHVGAYTRSPGDMTNSEIIGEIATLASTKAVGNAPLTNRMRLVSLERERAARIRQGNWHEPSAQPNRFVNTSTETLLAMNRQYYREWEADPTPGKRAAVIQSSEELSRRGA